MKNPNEYKAVKFSPDEVIFTEGDFGNSAYLVLSGEVHFSVLGNSAHKVIGAGTPNNIFGEMALFNHNTRMATAVAKTHVECVEITEEHIKKQIEETPFLIRALFHSMTQTMRQIGAEKDTTMPSFFPELEARKTV